MLAKKYTGQDVTGWLMSEKLDGVRATWDGKQLTSRNGNKFFAPKWFTQQLPPVHMDGELFAGRGKFQQTIAAVSKNKPADSEWKKIVYCVFDLPCVDGVFKNKLQYCRELLRGNRVASPVRQITCKSQKHLEEYFKTLCDTGAEGVIIRDPNSKYEYRRSDRMLKYKPIETDEAEVIGYEAGKGKYYGLTGALICKWKGKKFNLGTGLTDKDRKKPPAIGSKVTFSYKCLTDSGIPREPVYVCERNYEGFQRFAPLSIGVSVTQNKSGKFVVNFSVNGKKAGSVQ